VSPNPDHYVLKWHLLKETSLYRPMAYHTAVAGPRIWNSLPAALRTATPPVWLTDSASEDYLGRALQICASSSSSSHTSRFRKRRRLFI